MVVDPMMDLPGVSSGKIWLRSPIDGLHHSDSCLFVPPRKDMGLKQRLAFEEVFPYGYRKSRTAVHYFRVGAYCEFQVSVPTSTKALPDS